MLATGYLGVIRKENTVFSRWGNLLIDGEVRNPTEEELMGWVSWPAARPQCWLEWRRVRDVTAEEFFQHLEMMKGEPGLRWWKKLYGDYGVKEEKDGRDDGDEAAADEDESDPHEVREEEKDERSGGEEAVVNGDESDPRGKTMLSMLERIQTAILRAHEAELRVRNGRGSGT